MVRYDLDGKDAWRACGKSETSEINIIGKKNALYYENGIGHLNQIYKRKLRVRFYNIFSDFSLCNPIIHRLFFDIAMGIRFTHG